MGGDDFTTAKICGEKVYKQLADLREIVHPITGQTLTVHRRTTADGKARRTSTGCSTACSSYPIPEAPEHVDQLGDMKVLFEQPPWSLEETERMRYSCKTSWSKYALLRRMVSLTVALALLSTKF